MSNPPANPIEVEKVFRRIFNGGVMQRLPRSRKDAEIVLALAASALDPRAVYTEQEVNDVLIEWMDEFVDTHLLDHITIRRYLVDYFMVLREKNGSNYTPNQAVINRTITPEARMVRPADVMTEVQQARESRKQWVER